MNGSTAISTTLTLTMAKTACSLLSMVRWSSVPASFFSEPRKGEIVSGQKSAGALRMTNRLSIFSSRTVK